MRHMDGRSKISTIPAGGAGNDLSNTVLASYGIKYGNNANTGNLQKSQPLYGGTINPYRMWELHRRQEDVCRGSHGHRSRHQIWRRARHPLA